MKNRNDLINELSWLCGIVPEYWDIFGNRYEASQDTKEAILRAMRIKIDTEQEISEAIANIYNKQWLSFIEPVKVLSINNQPFVLSLFIPVSPGDEGRLVIYCRIEGEDGGMSDFTVYSDSFRVVEEKWINNQRYLKIDIRDDRQRETGYYSCLARCTGGTREVSGVTKIIIAPDACYIPAELEHGRKLWGLSLNLYSIRSRWNWGCGDFRDLSLVANWLTELNAGFAAINPLHALLNKSPYDISPYSPVSRLYKNLIYLDIENVPEVLESKKSRAAMKTKSFKDAIKKLSESDLVDYDEIASLKEGILRFAFENFYEEHYKKNTFRDRSFNRYLMEEGDQLQAFALFCVLYKMNGSEGWHRWQRGFQVPSSEEVCRFKQGNEKEILFYCYIQWLLDLQIKNIAETLNNSMAVGLVFDLAIGSTSGGSDVWNYQKIFASGINVGAPPDDFNPTGQDWGFPPLIPERLRETGYEFFIQTIRKNMKYAGALRIDHALGMFRLFWIPDGSLPSEGAYVKYPSEDLLRIIALESFRNKTLIIAEDLGTVGENVHDRLREFKMLSYKLLYFGRNYPDPSFTPPESYPQNALCSVTTHDLATICGFWELRDIEVKKALGLYVNEEKYLKHKSDRERDKELLLQALRMLGILSDEIPLNNLTVAPMSFELCLGIYEYLARTPCMLVSVGLDDILGVLEQQNLPGVVDLYPCWRQKLLLRLDDIVSDTRFLALSDMFKRNSRQ